MRGEEGSREDAAEKSDADHLRLELPDTAAEEVVAAYLRRHGISRRRAEKWARDPRGTPALVRRAVVRLRRARNVQARGPYLATVMEELLAGATERENAARRAAEQAELAIEDEADAAIDTLPDDELVALAADVQDIAPADRANPAALRSRLLRGALARWMAKNPATWSRVSSTNSNGD